MILVGATPILVGAPGPPACSPRRRSTSQVREQSAERWIDSIRETPDWREFGGRDVLLQLRAVQHVVHLVERSPGDFEEPRELGVSLTSKAFRNISTD